MTGAVRGRGSAHLVPGRDEPQITLSQDSGLTLRVPGPIVVGRPEEPAGATGLLHLPGELNLSAASADKPLLSVDGKVGTSSAGEAEESSSNLMLVDAEFELAATGGDAFGLRTREGLWAKFTPGTGIGLRGELHAEAGLEGLRRLVGAALAADLSLPDGGGEFGLRTESGTTLGGRIQRGRISIDTGPMASTGGSAIATRGTSGTIDGELRLKLGQGVPSAVAGSARLAVGGRFGFGLDPARAKAEQGSLLAGPVEADLSLGFELAPGTEYSLFDGLAPIVFKTPVRLDLGLAGGIVSGDALENLAVEVSLEQPVSAQIDLKPK